MFHRFVSRIQQGTLVQTVRALPFMQKALVALLTLVCIGALGWWGRALFVAMTIPAPARGGTYAEALVGRPIYFNPLLVRPQGADMSADAEASVVQLVYSGLFRSDGHGGVVPDLADAVAVSDDGLTYTVTLREHARWHDDTPVTADDVVFTYHVMQDARYPIVPSLAQAWRDVTVAQSDERTITFTLKKPFASFVAAQLRTGILPKHIWENVGPDTFALTKTNLRPIGSGPYMVQDVQTDDRDHIAGVTLSRFSDYHGTAPYIDRIIFSFFDTDHDAHDAYQTRRVQGVTISPRDTTILHDEDNAKTRIHRITLPTAYAVFFNPFKSAALGYADVRTALTMATDRDAIIAQVFGGEALSLQSGPFVPGMAWYSSSDAWPKTDSEAARALLEKNGWIAGQDGIRAKDGTVLHFTLVVPPWDDLIAVADMIKQQWRAVGADVEIIAAGDDFGALVKSREYGALLYGQSAFSFDADPFAFWHSSQKDAPGANFSQFVNKDADQILLDAQGERDDAKRADHVKKFTEILAKNAPAVFLFSPYDLYVQSTRVGGMSTDRISMASERFATISEWYVRTRRVFGDDKMAQ